MLRIKCQVSGIRCQVGHIVLLLTTYFLLLTPYFVLPAYAQDPDTTPAVAEGQLIWVQNCQPCHGPTGKGDGPSAANIPNPLPDFSDPSTARQLSPAQNFAVIKNGRVDKLMPPWANRLTDTQIWDAAAYVWRLSTSAQNLTTGEKLYTEQCAACHGPTGKGDGPQAAAPMLDFTAWQTMTQRSQADLQTAFAASSQHTALKLSDVELWQTLDYMRTFSFITPKANGTLTGQVMNGTTMQPQGNLTVTLRAIQDSGEVENWTTQADSTGRFAFDHLPTDHTMFYLAETEYNHITYRSSDPAVFTPNSITTTLTLNVYDTTTDPTAVSIGQLHVILGFAPDAANVVQLVILNNSGNRAYIGQNGQSFAFSLPTNAINVDFQEDTPGSRFVSTATGYADTAPVVPGENNIPLAIRYDVPFSADTLTIAIPIPTNAASVNVLLPDQGATLTSDQAQLMDTRAIQGQNYQIFSGTNLKQGDTLTLHLSNLSQLTFTAPSSSTEAGAAPSDQNWLRWLVLGLGGLAVIAAGVIYPLLRSRAVTPAAPDYNDPQVGREKLLLALARLDEVFEAGQLDEQVYRQARARYKAELAALMEES